MFHLAKGLYDNWNKKEGKYCVIALQLSYRLTQAEYAVLILGLDNAGKTTLLEKVKSIFTPEAKIIPVNRITTTVGQNVATIPIEKSLLKFWDIGGQESLRTLWSEYYDHCHGIIFVVDSSDRARIEECQKTLLSVVQDETILESIPILMLANKQDVPDHMEVEDIKEIFNKIAEHLSARDSRVLPISAITGDGVKESVEWLHTRIVRNKQNKPPKYKWFGNATICSSIILIIMYIIVILKAKKVEQNNSTPWKLLIKHK